MCYTLFVVLFKGGDTMVQAKIIEIGEKALDSTENLLLLFGETVTENLKTHAIIQKISEPTEVELEIGGKIWFDSAMYTIEKIGKGANKNLKTIEHVSFVFGEVPESDPLSSSVYLSPAILPKITGETIITYE